MTSWPMRLAVVAIALVLGMPAMAQKGHLVVVVKGLDNPFFAGVADGCAMWNEENPEAGYDCAFTAPDSSADELGQVELVARLIDAGVAGIAISPSNSPAMARMLRARKPAMPIITIDADFGKFNRDLRATYLGTNNYDMGVVMAKYLTWLNPHGGTVCLQLGNVAAHNINARARGFRDTIADQEDIERLEGQGGWTEVEGCPLYTNDQIDLANQQLANTLSDHPDLDALILAGGWAQFNPLAYNEVTDPVMGRLAAKDLIIIAGDTLPSQIDALRSGRSHVQIGQLPFEMGYRAPSVLIDLIEGREVEDPLYTGINECDEETAHFCVD